MAVKHTFAIIIDVVLMLDGIKNAHRSERLSQKECTDDSALRSPVYKYLPILSDENDFS
jgi:hypothetical protein